MQPDALVLQKASPNGAVQADSFFWYSGHLRGLTPIPKGAVPTYRAKCDDDPTIYELPVANGWLLEFRTLRGWVLERWAVYARNGEVYLDTGAESLNLTVTKPQISVTRVLNLVKIAIRCEGAMKYSFWVITPPIRFFFADPVSPSSQCEPIGFILEQLATSQGRKEWSERWTKGFSHLNVGMLTLNA
jgi:hypothetical protein